MGSISSAQPPPPPPTAAAAAAADPSSKEDEEAVIKAHLEELTAAQLPNSAIYKFLLSDVRIVGARRGAMRARLALGRNHMNSGGGIHGAASAAIVDWAGGMAVATWDLRRRTGVSVDIHVTYLSSAGEGDEVEIEAEADKVGGSLGFTRVVIRKVVDGVPGPVVANGSHTKFVKQR
ncbi:Thioesterase/thiol ester dehydrase-isomerase [Annulohypoxylon truncatum]|uniref:Thioesterase/thiol ester dehydrase-isomerase n=1 Tax=Annulohypoxylon truncatum TaxID=327061 RepID=UPI0020085F7E|nr:Thioesterase/thiol ester dehydrase-isomerase [Annulohypoxylon truncatum]KAI1211193.1 Thioesterase/thiol ester dehydrase-isomerase [Annulohypoxylon truncatum]